MNAREELAAAIEPTALDFHGSPNLNLAISARSLEVIQDVIADCGDNNPQVLASNIAASLAPTVGHWVAAHDEAIRAEIREAIAVAIEAQIIPIQGSTPESSKRRANGTHNDMMRKAARIARSTDTTEALTEGTEGGGDHGE